MKLKDACFHFELIIILTGKFFFLYIFLSHPCIFLTSFLFIKLEHLNISAQYRDI